MTSPHNPTMAGAMDVICPYCHSGHNRSGGVNRRRCNDCGRTWTLVRLSKLDKRFNETFRILHGAEELRYYGPREPRYVVPLSEVIQG